MEFELNLKTVYTLDEFDMEDTIRIEGHGDIYSLRADKNKWFYSLNDACEVLGLDPIEQFYNLYRTSCSGRFVEKDGKILLMIEGAAFVGCVYHNEKLSSEDKAAVHSQMLKAPIVHV